MQPLPPQSDEIVFYRHVEWVDPDLAAALAPYTFEFKPFPVGGASGLSPEINLLIEIGIGVLGNAV